MSLYVNRTKVFITNSYESKCRHGRNLLLTSPRHWTDFNEHDLLEQLALEERKLSEHGCTVHIKLFELPAFVQNFWVASGYIYGQLKSDFFWYDKELDAIKAIKIGKDWA